METMGPGTEVQLRRTSILRLAKLLLEPDFVVYVHEGGLVETLMGLVEGVVDNPVLGEATAAMLLVLHHNPQHVV